MFNYFLKKSKKKPPYIDVVEDLGKLQIVRLKGDIDQSMIPSIQERITDNRKQGGFIEKNILLDFKKVKKVDSATIAFNIIRLREYQSKNHQFALVNISKNLRPILEIFKVEKTFKIYRSEKQAVKDLNK